MSAQTNIEQQTNMLAHQLHDKGPIFSCQAASHFPCLNLSWLMWIDQQGLLVLLPVWLQHFLGPPRKLLLGCPMLCQEFQLGYVVMKPCKKLCYGCEPWICPMAPRDLNPSELSQSTQRLLDKAPSFPCYVSTDSRLHAGPLQVAPSR